MCVYVRVYAIERKCWDKFDDIAESLVKNVRVVQDTWSTRCYEKRAESSKCPSVTNEFLWKC